MRGNGSEGTGEGVSDVAPADTDATGEVKEVGPFRIYLGAAPGVGKTYAMLSEGQRRRRRGTDVVAGLVESYGRPHTEELINGLEVIPRKAVDYRGRRLEEMDLDAVLRTQIMIGSIQRNWWHIADGGPILRRVIHEAGASGIDVHLIARREAPHAEALDSSAAKES